MRPSVTGWILCGSAAAIVVGSLLPWAQESVLGYTISSSPTGGGPVLLMALAAGAFAFGWPLLRGTNLSNWRSLGLAVVASIVSIIALANFSNLGKLQHQYPGAGITAGSGLFLYALGVILMWGCLTMVIGYRKGRPAAGFILGFLFGLIGLAIIFVLRPKAPEASPGSRL